MNTIEQTIALLVDFRDHAIVNKMELDLYYDVAGAIAASTEDYPRKNKNYVQLAQQEYDHMYKNYDLYPPGLHTCYIIEESK